MKEVFDDYTANNFGAEKQAQIKFSQFEINYREYFPTNCEAHLLDIGIGLGEMLSLMRKWNYANYSGIDISPSTVRFCNGLGLNAILVEDTISYLQTQIEQYDLITLLDVLEHIKKERIIPFLKAIKLALKKGGRLIIQVPNLQAPDGQLHRYNDITHEIGFIEHSLAQVLICAGFSNFKFVGFEELALDTPRDYAKKFVRSIHWFIVRALRAANGNLNPKILNPVFSAIVQRDVS